MNPIHCNRRQLAGYLTALGLAAKCSVASSGISDSELDRCEGLLLGSMLGDAMGGPLEFASGEPRRGRVVNARSWDKKKTLDAKTIRGIADQTSLIGYEVVRPDPAAYGPWKERALAGTVTDDSRWKIILVRAVRLARSTNAKKLEQKHIAKAIVDFQPHIDKQPDENTRRLLEEGLQEYRYAANWVLGQRDPAVALPIDRLWAGIPNCSGQMMLPPLAIMHAGEPESAYRESFRINFIDSAGAKDIASSIVASLASVLGANADDWSSRKRWQVLLSTLRTLDPLRLKAVPFAGRPLDKWLDLVDDILKKANGRPAVAYQLLETEGKPVYFWDAHFTLLVALTLLKLSNFNAMCALSLAIDFGHDTDSYAQLIGAFAGAVLGTSAFPTQMRQQIQERLQADFGEDLAEWSRLLGS